MGTRAAHGELLRLIEQGRLSWADVPARSKAINKALRRAQLSATGGGSEGSGGNSNVPSKPNGNTNKRPCPQYQVNDCDFSATHTSDGTTWLHCCATCFHTKNQRYSHPKSLCRRGKPAEEKPPPKNE